MNAFPHLIEEMIEQLTPTHTPHHHVEVRGIIPVEEMDAQNVRVLQLAQYSDLVNTPKRVGIE